MSEAIRIAGCGGEVFATVTDTAGHRTLVILTPREAREVAASLFNKASAADAYLIQQAVTDAGALMLSPAHACGGAS